MTSYTFTYNLNNLNLESLTLFCNAVKYNESMGLKFKAHVSTEYILSVKCDQLFKIIPRRDKLNEMKQNMLKLKLPIDKIRPSDCFIFKGKAIIDPVHLSAFQTGKYDYTCKICSINFIPTEFKTIETTESTYFGVYDWLDVNKDAPKIQEFLSNEDNNLDYLSKYYSISFRNTYDEHCDYILNNHAKNGSDFEYLLNSKLKAQSDKRKKSEKRYSKEKPPKTKKVLYYFPQIHGDNASFQEFCEYFTENIKDFKHLLFIYKFALDYIIKNDKKGEHLVLIDETEFTDKHKIIEIPRKSLERLYNNLDTNKNLSEFDENDQIVLYNATEFSSIANMIKSYATHAKVDIVCYDDHEPYFQRNYFNSLFHYLDFISDEMKVALLIKFFFNVEEHVDKKYYYSYLINKYNGIDSNIELEVLEKMQEFDKECKWYDIMYNYSYKIREEIALKCVTHLMTRERNVDATFILFFGAAHDFVKYKNDNIDIELISQELMSIP